jgi:hypothetical protein
MGASTEQVGNTLNWAGLGPHPGGLHTVTPQWANDPVSWWKNKLFGGGGGSSTYASDKFADMAYGQWQQWVSQFMPVENTLINYASDRTLPSQEAAKAVSGVQSAYGQQAKMQDLTMRTAGIQLNPEERQAFEREKSLSQSLSEVQASNMARQMTTDRQRSTLGVPMNTGDLALRGGR